MLKKGGWREICRLSLAVAAVVVVVGRGRFVELVLVVHVLGVVSVVDQFVLWQIGHFILSSISK